MTTLFCACENQLECRKSERAYLYYSRQPRSSVLEIRTEQSSTSRPRRSLARVKYIFFFLSLQFLSLRAFSIPFMAIPLPFWNSHALYLSLPLLRQSTTRKIVEGGEISLHLSRFQIRGKQQLEYFSFFFPPLLKSRFERFSLPPRKKVNSKHWKGNVLGGAYQSNYGISSLFRVKRWAMQNFWNEIEWLAIFIGFVNV